MMLRLATVVKDWKVDPGAVGTGPAAPKDVGHVERTTVLKQRSSVTDADDTRDAFDTGTPQFRWLDAYQRVSSTHGRRSYAAADGRTHRQEPMENDPQYERLEHVAP